MESTAVLSSNHGLCFSFPIIDLKILIQVPIVAVSFLYIYLCYETSLPQALYIGTASYTIGQIAGLFCSLTTLLNPRLFAHFGSDIPVNLYGLALVTGYYILFALLTSLSLKHIAPGVNILKNATVPIVLLSTIMLAVNQILGLSFALYGAADASPLICFLEYIWNLICCIFCLCIQFDIFRMSQKEQELEIARKLIAEKEQQYAISKTSIDAINRKCHNLKYELSALSTGEEGQKHLEEAIAMVDSFDSQVRTGNDVLNVILSEKSQYCQQEEISFVCMADGRWLDFIDPTDLYVLFGNLIDNAIHAVENLEPSSRRVIYIRIHAKKKLLLINMENPFAGALFFRDGLPLTTNADEENHGFGMPSIRLICEKYGGAVNTRAEKGTFYLNIMIPLP